MKTKIKGLTLIELMMVILVMAIISMIAIPSFRQILAKQQLNSDYRELSIALVQARNQAVFLRKETKLNFVEGTQDDTNYYWQAQYKTAITAPTSSTPITFRKDGTLKAVSSDLTFQMCHLNSRAAKNFILTKSGSIFHLADGACT